MNFLKQKRKSYLHLLQKHLEINLTNEVKEFSNINTEERPVFDPNRHIKAPCWHRTIPALNAGGRRIRDLTSFPTTQQARGQPGTNEMHNNKKIHVAKKCLRKGSTSLIIKEIYVKMMWRIHLIWSEWLSSRKQLTTKRKGNPYILLLEM